PSIYVSKERFPVCDEGIMLPENSNTTVSVEENTVPSAGPCVIVVSRENETGAVDTCLEGICAEGSSIVEGGGGAPSFGTTGSILNGVKLISLRLSVISPAKKNALAVRIRRRGRMSCIFIDCTEFL
ncbi:MAG: hypothetical protein QF775_03135, partial [archaeon]|nr:hypothetical protein [archaeon]